MTPIRNDGSIGQMVEVSLDTPLKKKKNDGRSMKECFLEYKKREHLMYEKKAIKFIKSKIIYTVIISQQCDLACCYASRY